MRVSATKEQSSDWLHGAVQRFANNKPDSDSEITTLLQVSSHFQCLGQAGHQVILIL